MSKKESDSERYDRMKKLVRESEVEKRKNSFLDNEDQAKVAPKAKTGVGSAKKKREKNYSSLLESDLDYI